MRNLMKLFAAVPLLCFFICACGANPENNDNGANKKPSVIQDNGHQDHEQEHLHKPRFGGKPYMIGEHEYHVEVLLDAENGRLDLYLGNGCNTGAAQIPADRLTLIVGPDKRELILKAEAMLLAGEKPGGPYSHFYIEDHTLKGLMEFEATLNVSLFGKDYSRSFHYPKADGAK